MRTKAIQPILASALIAATLTLQPFVSASDQTAPSIRDVKADTCLWGQVTWTDMNMAEQAAWTVLGWNAANWNTEDKAAEPSSESRKWSEMNPEEQAAASSLGYDQKGWDGENCD